MAALALGVGAAQALVVTANKAALKHPRRQADSISNFGLFEIDMDMIILDKD